MISRKWVAFIKKSAELMHPRKRGHDFNVNMSLQTQFDIFKKGN